MCDQAIDARERERPAIPPGCVLPACCAVPHLPALLPCCLPQAFSSLLSAAMVSVPRAWDLAARDGAGSGRAGRGSKRSSSWQLRWGQALCATQASAQLQARLPWSREEPRVGRLGWLVGGSSSGEVGAAKVAWRSSSAAWCLPGAIMVWVAARPRRRRRRCRHLARRRCWASCCRWRPWCACLAPPRPWACCWASA